MNAACTTPSATNLRGTILVSTAGCQSCEESIASQFATISGGEVDPSVLPKNQS